MEETRQDPAPTVRRIARRRVAQEDCFFLGGGRRTLQQRRQDDLHTTLPLGVFLAGVINVS